MIDKHAKPTKLLWLDLEMTGFDAQKDVILEVAVIVTDFDFKLLEGYETAVRQDRELVLERMNQNAWWQDYALNRQELLEKTATGKPNEVVERELLAIVKRQFGPEPAVLAGSSMYMDRGFIQSYWPRLYDRLHYRMLDVSALKAYMQGKYGVEFRKKETHRAADDIKESIAEWQYYLDYLSKL